MSLRPQVAPARPRTVHLQVVESLGRRIVRGELDGRPAAPMREAELQAAFGVSRSAVREALKTLSGKGLVQSRQRLGTRALPYDDWNLFDADVMNWQFRAAGPARAIGDLIGLRRIIEPSAAALAASLAGADDVERMRAAVAAMRASVERVDAFNRADVAFHVALFDATRNAYLRRLGRLIAGVLVGAFDLANPDAADALRSARRHARVVEAIAARDPDAARARMARLIDLAEADLARLPAMHATGSGR